jgi:ABC-type multidrug transport system fused ATPase/permease subunit
LYFVPFVTSTLVFQSLIQYTTTSYVAHREGTQTPGIGKGIGLAFALVILQLIGSLCQHHFFYRCASTGVLLRGGLITAIYTRSLRLTTRARATLPNGRLVNHISTDVSRIDFCCGFFHMLWAAPIQMAICLALLISNLGPSALAGFFVFIICTPVQGKIMKSLFKIRRKTMVWTDKRAKLLQELLGGMRLIKFFAWEIPFLNRIAEYRKHEMR